ncbi:hypothetical protein [Moorena sp. SIO3I6]|uniref:hypothetical protein n=1 Tax=Moorena sp. SIO3I6 TaxID=2607831 RepID=UPI0013F8BF87|nr:hypothetical protein [Moorena sp. SIO3I6]NEP20975.1 hypothetical protein [Moorena sp. SIO3I6]
MKYPIRVLLSLVTLCTIGLGTDNLSAPVGAYEEKPQDSATSKSNQCSEIRAVRRLAIRENLDSDNLATLEYKYCRQSNRRSSSRQSNQRNRRNRRSSSIESLLNSSQDCFDLTVMAELASMTEKGRKFVSTIRGLQQVTCKRSRQGQRSSLYWPNGETAKWASNWYYPNGQQLKWSHWYYYPDGKTAKSGSDWDYPNGQDAKWASNWYTPKGRTTSVDSLLSQACSIVSSKECDRILTYINRFDQNRSNRNRRSTLWRNLAIVKLSWQTYQQTNQSK